MARWRTGRPGRANSTGRPSLSICVNGRSDLPGPLCNVYLDRQGVCVVVAAGVANHAGSGATAGCRANSSVLGVEAECCNAGDWTDKQLQNYPILLAALVAGCGKDETWIARHCDWTTRKIDTNDLALSWLQSQAAIALGGGRPSTDEATAIAEAADMIVGQDQSTGRIWSISGGVRNEWPAGGGKVSGDGHSAGNTGHVYVDELLAQIAAAYPGSDPKFVALNPDLVARTPMLWTTIDGSAPDAVKTAPREQAGGRAAAPE